MKYTVEKLGPTKQITSKKTGKLLTVYQVKFNEDPNWTDVFSDNPIAIGQEFEGTVEQGPYGWSFKKDRFPNPMRASGYSNRQIALQCASRFSKDAQTSLEAAETFLKWLEVSDTPTPPPAAQQPQKDYSGLGL